MKRVTFTLEFLFKASPTIVYTFLTTPDYLTRWFCDDCNLIDDYYYFVWNGNEEAALILEDIEDERIKLQWDGDDDEYLCFEMDRAEVTGETILKITAFCDKDELEAERRFWATQMESLRRAMGG